MAAFERSQATIRVFIAVIPIWGALVWGYGDLSKISFKADGFATA
jgi:hypothetical protein